MTQVTAVRGRQGHDVDWPWEWGAGSLDRIESLSYLVDQIREETGDVRRCYVAGSEKASPLPSAFDEATTALVAVGCASNHQRDSWIRAHACGGRKGKRGEATERADTSVGSAVF